MDETVFLSCVLTQQSQTDLKQDNLLLQVQDYDRPDN